MNEDGQDKFTRLISYEINLLQKQILDICEIVVPNNNWIHFRKKILDLINNSRRKLQEEIKANYCIEYDPTFINDEVIKICKDNKGEGNYGNRKNN